MSLLNPAQQDAVNTLYGPVLVLAGAGSGKTRVVTYRIASMLHQGVSPSAILGVTFTNKAAGEMKERVQQLTNQQVLICTFHSLGARILREAIEMLGYKRDFLIYDEQDTEKLMKACLQELAGDQKIEPKMFLEHISRLKNALHVPEENSQEQDLLSKVCHLYQSKLKECNAVDFDDLLYLPIQLFKQSPEVLAHYQKRWSFLLVDEYQDTNHAQDTLIRYLVAQHKNICVVGDPDQSIYSWRGAEIRNILRFEKEYPGAKVVKLEQNYRSRSNILDAANELILHNRTTYEKKLWSDRGPGEKIKLSVSDTERGEADFVVEKIRLHYEQDRIPLKEMAVFYRTNAQSRALEDRFLLHKIPYVIVGGISFYQRKEIKDVLAFLRMAHSGVDYVSFIRTINLPKRGLGEATIEKIRSGAAKEGRTLLGYCDALVAGQGLQHPVRLTAKQREALASYVGIIHELRELSKTTSLKNLVKAAISNTGYVNFLQEFDKESFIDRQENLSELIAKAAEWEESVAEPSLEAFLEELSLKSSVDEADTSNDRVSLMTLHNSKGLEFDVVFLVGMEEGLFPHANVVKERGDIDEERRLFYVGMTRAKEFLYLCHVRLRFLWGVTRNQQPSRFLDEIPSKYIEKERKRFVRFSSDDWDEEEEDESVEEPFSDEIEVSPVVNKPHLSVGDAVFHQMFGVGVIREVYEASLGLTYKVLFSNDNRERALVAHLAPLKKL